MQTDASEKKWPLLTIIGIVCVMALLAMIIQSLVHFFNPPPETKVEENAVNTVTKTANQPDVKSISVAGEHPFVNPVSEPASVLPAPSQSQPASSQRRTEFNTDFKTIQEREKERRVTIDNMRKTIRAGNLDTNAVMQQEKKLKKIEDSGASFI